MEQNMLVEAMDSLDPIYDSSGEEIRLAGEEWRLDPFPIQHRLREIHPVCRLSPIPLWLVTRYEDVREALLDDRLFIPFDELNVALRGPDIVNEPFFRVGKEMLPGNEPPIHTVMRRVFGEPFTPKRVREWIPAVDQFANEQLDMLQAAGNQADLVKEYAHPVLTAVISTILTVPRSDWDLLDKWNQKLVPMFDPIPLKDEALATLNESITGLEDYYTALIEERRKNPGDDFVSGVLRENERAENPLTDLQIVANLATLYFAGSDSQTAQFSNIIDGLDRFPAEREKLVQNPDRVPEAMAEFFRWGSPGHYIGRIAHEDVVIGGQTVPAGEVIFVSFTAANRDPEVFEDPDRLDIDRQPNDSTHRHLNFGIGRHFCLGNQIAQMNMNTILPPVLKRLKNFRVVREEAIRRQEWAMNGWKYLPVTWEN